jgi:hypothetical protein
MQDLTEVMNALGFEKKSVHHFEYPHSDFHVEFSSAPLGCRDCGCIGIFAWSAYGVLMLAAMLLPLVWKLVLSRAP